MDANEHKTEDINELRAQLRAQATEIERLQAQLGDTSDRVSRRGLIKGLGLGGLVALGTTGAGLSGNVPSALAAPGAAVETSDLVGELPALLRLKLGTSDIPGDVTGTSDRAGSIEVLYYQSDVKSPRDPATGLPTGRRQYQPIIIRKRIDKSSPFLARAIATNQTGEATIRFYRHGHGPGNSGAILHCSADWSHDCQHPAVAAGHATSLPAKPPRRPSRKLSFTFRGLPGPS